MNKFLPFETKNMLFKHLTSKMINPYNRIKIAPPYTTPTFIFTGDISYPNVTANSSTEFVWNLIRKPHDSIDCSLSMFNMLTSNTVRRVEGIIVSKTVRDETGIFHIFEDLSATVRLKSKFVVSMETAK